MKRSMISFDWAMKRLLRQKAGFEVLEGFLSELLYRKIKIRHIGESEGNKSDEGDKTNRVDILVEADDRELAIIELQYDGIDEYFHRMLYGVSKAVADYMRAGDAYSKVRKVYSINIVYFELGTGDDYIYHGFTNFKGLHTHNELQLTASQRKLYGKTAIGNIYPEYYIVKVNGFDDIAKNTLDEWVYYLKNNRIEDHFTAKGLDKAKELLLFDNLSEAEKERYLHDLDARLLRDGEIRTALFEGELKGLEKGEAIGLEKGEAIGLEKGIEKMIINGFKKGMSMESISAIADKTPEEINRILKKHDLQ
jgi:predicted transposase/invertase (TIGR01784 family)